MKLKEAGRGETNNWPPIPDETMDAIFKFAATHQELFDARVQKDLARYEVALGKIPVPYRNRYHETFAYLAQFVFTRLDGRRGAEGLDKLKKNHWVVEHNNGKRYLKKVGTSVQYRSISLIFFFRFFRSINWILSNFLGSW